MKAIVLFAILGLAFSARFRAAHDVHRAGSHAVAHRPHSDEVHRAESHVTHPREHREEGAKPIHRLHEETHRADSHVSTHKPDGDEVHRAESVTHPREYREEGAKPIHRLHEETHRAGSFVSNHRAAIKEGAETIHDYSHGNYGKAVIDGVHTLHDALPKHGTIGRVSKDVNGFVSKHQDAIKHGADAVGDYTHGNYGGAVVNGVHTLHDILPKHGTVGKVSRDVNNFVSKHQGAIRDGVNTVGDAVKGDYGDAVVNGVHTLHDIIPKHSEAGKIAGDVNRFVTKHSGVISNGVNAAGDAIKGNYVGAVGDGLHAIADAIPKNNAVGKAIGKVSNFISKEKSGYGGAVEEGINTAADVATGNVGGAVVSAAHGVGDLVHGIMGH